MQTYQFVIAIITLILIEMVVQRSLQIRKEYIAQAKASSSSSSSSSAYVVVSKHEEEEEEQDDEGPSIGQAGKVNRNANKGKVKKKMTMKNNKQKMMANTYSNNLLFNIIKNKKKKQQQMTQKGGKGTKTKATNTYLIPKTEVRPYLTNQKQQQVGGGLVKATPPKKNPDGSIPNWPMIVFHLGPVKTGTTTLQAAIGADYSRLLQDRFELPGGRGFYQATGKVQCFRGRTTGCKNDPRWQSLVQQIRSILSRNHSVLMSQENWPEMINELNEDNWRMFQSAFRGYHTKFIITYRRYFSWLPSHYYQEMRAQGGPGKAYRQWPSKNNNTNNNQNTDQRPIPIFPDYFDWTNQKDSPHPFVRRHEVYFEQHKHPSQIIIEKYKEHFKDHPNVEFIIHNMHANRNVAQSFYCTAMKPYAKNTCNYRKNHMPRTANVATSHNYDMLAVEAYQQGLITRRNGKLISRKDAKAKVRDRQEKVLKKSGIDFPLKCMSDGQLDLLLNISLSYEKQFVPVYYNSPNGEILHREEFQDAKRKKKFCSIDAKKILQTQPQWVSFFKNLH